MSLLCAELNQALMSKSSTISLCVFGCCCGLLSFAPYFEAPVPTGMRLLWIVLEAMHKLHGSSSAVDVYM